MKRFVQVLAHTTNESASELEGKYFRFKYENGKFLSKSEYLNYILNAKTSLKLDFSKADKMVDPEINKDKLEVFEVVERKWLINFEKRLQREAKESVPNLTNIFELLPKTRPR